jgi:hypothetical protein
MFALRQRRRAAWIAVFAILLNALAPALSHAVAARLGAALLEICTADGLKRVAVHDQGVRPDVPSGAHAALGDHCPYCAPHGASVGHPPSGGPLVALFEGPALIVAVEPESALQRADGSSGDARAPPVVS